MAKLYVGIDIGFSGGFSFLEKKGDKFVNACVFKTPIYVDDKGKKQYDIDGVIKIFKDNVNCDYKDVVCVLENVHFFSQQGGVSAFTFAYGAGILTGVVRTLGIQLEKVNPMTWKKQSFPQLLVDGSLVKALPKEAKKERSKLKAKLKAEAKDKARALASELHPELAHQFQKKNTDGLAESVLLARYIASKFP